MNDRERNVFLTGLAKLSGQERAVLKLRCQGHDYKEISKKIFISVSTVKQYMSRIYVKLGLDQFSRTERTRILFQDICPLLATIERTEAAPESTEPEVIPADVIDMVEEDEKAIVVWQPAPLRELPRQPSPPRRSHPLRGLLIGAVLGCIGLALALAVLNNVFGFFPTGQPTSQSIPDLTTTQVALEMTSGAALEQPAAQPELTSDVSESIVIPTATSPPPAELPVLTPLPQPRILFADNFDQGLSPAWNLAAGNPVILDGTLTTDQDTWLMIGDSSWTDYKVEFTGKAMDCWFSWSWNAVGLRVQDLENMVAFKWAFCENEWDIVKSGNWTTVPNSNNREGSYEGMRISITVEGDQFSVNYDGMRVSSFFNSDFRNGGVAIKIAPNSTIDDLKITAINE